MKRHAFHPEAVEEYVHAVEYYATISPSLGRRFFEEMERLIKKVCENPKRYFGFSPPARRALARRFPYSLVFVNLPDRIWIVAVAHSKRQPGYWRQRL